VNLCLSLRSCLLLSILAGAFAAEPLGEGLHENQVVPETPWTFDAYIPKDYKAHAERKYPTLFLSSPGGNPGVKSWRAFAEEHDFVIVSMNNTKNGMSWADIDVVQDKTLAAITDVIRVHPVLRYSSGTSGGGWCSIRLAMRNPKNWASVQISAHSGNGDVAGDGIAIGMYSGREDKVHPFKSQESVSELYKAKGNPIRFIAHDGGHEQGELQKILIPLVLFCYEQTLLGSPYLSKDERAESAIILQEKIDESLKLSDPEKRRLALERYFSFVGFSQTPLMKGLAPTWLKSVRESGEAAQDKISQHFLYGMAMTHPYFTAVSKEDKKALQDAQKLLQKDPALKDEVKALQVLVKLLAAEQAGTKDIKKIATIKEGYQYLSDKFAATKAGEYAKTK
jgi:hypothetical protein